MPGPGGDVSHYFLTGATGVVGSATVPVLLARPDATAWLLIRARDDADNARRLGELLRFWGWTDDREKRSRIRALRGDAAAPQVL